MMRAKIFGQIFMTTRVIGISGPSGSGKSWFSEHLRDLIETRLGAGSVTILQEDCYYNDQTEMSFEERCQCNYDHPEAFEHELLARQLARLKSGEAIEAPLYDYCNHNRRKETQRIPPANLVIVEGIMLFHNPHLRDELELKIYIDTPWDICLMRRIQRDTKERGRSLDSILQQYETTVRPMLKQFLAPTMEHADITINGYQTLDEEVTGLADQVSRLL